MDRAGHDAKDAWNRRKCVADRHHACGRADHIHDVAELDSRADGVPVGVERSDRNRDARGEAELLGPLGRQRSGDRIRAAVVARHLLAHAGQARIERGEEIFARKAAERLVPQPLMACGADTPRQLR